MIYFIFGISITLNIVLLLALFIIYVIAKKVNLLHSFSKEEKEELKNMASLY